MKIHFESLAIARVNKKYYDHRHYSDWVRMITHGKDLYTIYIDSNFFDLNVVNIDHRSLRKTRIAIECDFDLSPEMVQSLTEEALDGRMGSPVLLAPIRSKVSSTFSAGVIGVPYLGICEDRDRVTKGMECGILMPVPRDEGTASDLSARLRVRNES